MNNKLKITGLILAGYALGRTKKLGLALTVASTLAGSTAVRNRDQLMDGLKDFAESSPELKGLQEKITGRLADSGKNAAKAMAAKGIDQLSNKLQDETEKMKSTLDEAADDLDPTSEASEDERDDGDQTVESETVEDDADDTESADVDEPEDRDELEDEEPQEEAPKKPARKKSSSSKSSSNTTGAKKSSSTSRRSSRSPSARKGSAAKRTSGSRKADSRKTEEADDE